MSDNTPVYSDLWDVMRVSEKALFHNKYFTELDHTVMDCMEERAVAKNRQEFEADFGHSNNN